MALFSDKFLPFLWFLHLNIRLQMTSMDKHCRPMRRRRTLFGCLLHSMRTWLKWMSTRVYILTERDLASGICPKETEMLFRNDDMYISFWLNRYQTNKYNAARRKNFTWFITFWKPTHLFFIPFSNYIIQLGAGEEKIVPSMEQEINHFGAIKKIGYVFHFFFCKSM